MTVTSSLHGPSRLRSRVGRAALGVAASVGLTLGLLAGGTASAGTPSTFAEALAQLRHCESSGNYAINTGNGYYGAYQFNLSTWRSVGGSGYPHQNPPHVQDEMATRLYESRGWQPWPACSRKLALPHFSNPREAEPQQAAVQEAPPPPPPPFDGEQRRVAHAAPSDPPAPTESADAAASAEPTSSGTATPDPTASETDDAESTDSE